MSSITQQAPNSCRPATFPTKMVENHYLGTHPIPTIPNNLPGWSHTIFQICVILSSFGSHISRYMYSVARFRQQILRWGRTLSAVMKVCQCLNVIYDSQRIV